MKLTAYVPGASAVVGVHVNVPETGDVPCMVAKLESNGNWLAERVRLDVGTEESVAVTAKVTVEV
jgi:hypothetical protein